MTSASSTPARLAAELSAEIGCDAVVGFSMGASVALEMVASGAFSGPVVLLGISLSLQDEPVFLRALDRLGVVMGSLPYSAMRQMMGSVTKHVRVPEAAPRRAPRRPPQQRPAGDARSSSAATCSTSGATTHRRTDSATRACPPGSCTPRRATAGSPTTNGAPSKRARTPAVVTIPGTSFFLPNEESERIAGYVVEALARL